MATSIPTSDELNAMSPVQYKTYENRLRRAAERQGLRLERSRRRDRRATDYGTYMLVDPDTNTIAVCGLPSGYGLRLHDVDRELNEPDSSSVIGIVTGGLPVPIRR